MQTHAEGGIANQAWASGPNDEQSLPHPCHAAEAPNPRLTVVGAGRWALGTPNPGGALGGPSAAGAGSGVFMTGRQDGRRAFSTGLW